MRAHLLLNYVLMVNPAFLWIFFELSHPRFIPNHPSYQTALMYNAIFTVIVCLTFIVWRSVTKPMKIVQKQIFDHPINTSYHITVIAYITIGLAFLGYLSKFGLDMIGSFRMLDAAQQQTSPFLQATKMFASFDLIALIILGELRKRVGLSNILPSIFLPIVILISFAAAILSGSRAQSMIVLILAFIAYYDFVKAYKVIVYPSIVAILPTIFFIFPLLGHYRNNNYDFTAAQVAVSSLETTSEQIMQDILVTRLNYLEPVARTIDYVDRYGSQGGAVYFNNVIALVPRAIWVDKPIVTNNSREIGHNLGLVNFDDNRTSIGLQVTGEAYYEFGWAGLFVAIMQGVLFAIVHVNTFRKGNAVATAIYVMTCIFLLQRDGYFAVLPGLVWLAIGFAIFLLPYHVLLRTRGV